MKKTTLWVILIVGWLILTGALILKKGRETSRASAAPTVLTGSLQGGCYLITLTACKLSVEPFSISIAPTEKLISFHLTANDQVLYDLSASEADPVMGLYTPSLVALDFAAQCGETYTLKLHALDTGDLDFITIGQTQPVTCPTATFKNYLPLLDR